MTELVSSRELLALHTSARTRWMWVVAPEVLVEQFTKWCRGRTSCEYAVKQEPLMEKWMTGHWVAFGCVVHSSLI